MQSVSRNAKSLPEDLSRLLIRIQDYLVRGSSRKKLICHVQKTLRMITDLKHRELMQNEFMTDLVQGIRHKTMFHISQSRLFLFRLWQTLRATADQWTLLRRLPWYQDPSPEQLKIDDFRTGRLRQGDRVEELKDVATLIGRKELTSRRQRSRGSIRVMSRSMTSSSYPHDVPSTSSGKRCYIPDGVGHLTSERRVPAVVEQLTKGGSKGNQRSPPAKKSCIPDGVGHLKRESVPVSKVACQDSVIIRSIVLIPPSSSFHEEAERRERDMRERLVAKHAVAQTLSSPLESRQQAEVTQQRTHDIVSEDEMSGSVLVEQSTKDDHFLGPLNKAVRREEQLRNASSVQLKKSPPLFAIIDVEGKSPDLAEIAVILCTENEMLEARVYPLKVRNVESLRQGTRYCHGIDQKVLMAIAKYDEVSALKEIRQWLENQRVHVTVLSADENSNSDISRLVNGWKVKYVPVPLPRWSERVATKAYIETQVGKGTTVEVLKAVCPYEKLHKRSLLTKPQRIQVSDGPHCAISDCRHLYRHIELNFLWPMIRSLSVHAVMPHVNRVDEVDQRI
jgi:hypothetical protein